MGGAAPNRPERRLAAILAADVVGYSRLMGADEEGTLERLKALRREVIDPKIAENKGRIVKTTGDGLLVEFASVVDAVRCAAEWQGAMPEECPIAWRIGVNLGDVIAEESDIYGDGVNVAARLEAFAEPGGICVSGIVHEQVRDKLDLAFEDSGEQSLKNIARPLRVYRVGTAARSNAPLPLPEKPSIAVLPFQNLSGDPEQDYFADGMVEEIITALSRIRSLFVIARNSSFTYKGQAVDVKRVGRELGVRYVLEGSVRKAGNRVRITAQLVDAASGAHLWADRFDGPLENVFDLQDQVATNVAGVIEPTVQAAETARLASRQATDLTAYDAYLRAYAMLFTSAQQIPQALALLERAIARDPNYGPALAWAAICCERFVIDETSNDPDTDRRKAIEYAQRALRVAGDDPGILANAALAQAGCGEDIESMIALVDRALSLNPSFARGWYIRGMLHNWAGEPELAIADLEASLKLSPRGRIGTIHSVIGFALFQRRRFDEAIAKLLLGLQDTPNFPHALRCLAACYAHQGRLDEARKTVARLREITPLVVPNAGYLRDRGARELLLLGLRLAAGETS